MPSTPNPAPPGPPFFPTIPARPGGPLLVTPRDVQGPGGVPLLPSLPRPPRLSPLSWHECNMSLLVVVRDTAAKFCSQRGKQKDAGEGEAGSPVGTMGTAQPRELEFKAICTPSTRPESEGKAPLPWPSCRFFPSSAGFCLFFAFSPLAFSVRVRWCAPPPRPPPGYT